MALVRRDLNEARYYSIIRLPKISNPDYYMMLIKNAKFLFHGVGRPDLVEELDFVIKHRVEIPMGIPLNELIPYYKNITFLNGYARSKNPLYMNVDVHKYKLNEYLDGVEEWILRRLSEIEPEIRFTGPSANFI